MGVGFTTTPPTTTSARRRRPSACALRGARPSLGVSAALAAVCCSTVLLQALTTSAAPKAVAPPAPAATSSGLLTALLARVGASPTASSPQTAADVRTMDLRVANVSVHRVRYVDSEQQPAPLQQQQSDDDGDDADAEERSSDTTADSSSWWNDSRAESLVGRWTRTLRSLRERRRAAHVTSVVVTWDDHFRSNPALAGDGSEDNAGHDDEHNEAESVMHAESSARSGVEVTYELQHWVNSWGLDGLWHPSNRVVAVADPFVVLSSLPQEHEIAFRVRMKVKQTSGLLSSGWFATETEGPWSAVTLLSPSRDDALAAILVFLLSNKTFFLVLLLCIGSGTLVVCKLFVSHRLAISRSSSRALAPSAMAPTDALDESASDSSYSPQSARSPLSKPRHAAGSDLAQEIKDLRQELADSEAEVRKLMVFRGYGMERLAAPELALVEQELRATLQRAQKLRKLHAPAAASGGITSSEDDTEGDEVDEAEFHRRLSSHGGRDRGRGCRRRLGVVPESLASEPKCG